MGKNGKGMVNKAGGPPPGVSPMGGPPPGVNPMGDPPPGANPMGGPPPGVNTMGGPPPGVNPMGGPPPGANPMGGPPPGVNPMGGPPPFINKHYLKNGTMPPQMRQMAPDFRKIRLALFIMDLIWVVVIFVVGLIMRLNHTEYITQSEFVTVTIINFAAIAVQGAALKLFPGVDILQHILPILVQIVVITAASSVHAGTDCISAAYCIPMFISVIYYNNAFIFTTAVFSVAGTVLSAIIRCSGDVEAGLRQTPVTLTVLICAYFFDQAVCRMMNEQKKKMAGVIMEAKSAQAQALEANKAKSLFLANMSHEIRTPINAILGMNEMILREEHDPAIREYASNIYSSGNLLLSIISDVLDISKIESGKIEITPTRYDVSSLINDCYNMTASRARKKKIDLNVEFAEDLPRLLWGDEAQLRQIIVNLLTNAVKYTDEGSVVFIVFGAAGSDDDFMLTVSVRDTGIGISEEDQKKLFKQFTRLDLDHNRNIEGTGLGLTIVKHLVDLMSGEISVKSEVGKGSEFTVRIPQKVIDATPTGRIELNYSGSADYEYMQTFEAPDAHILAVDDLPVNLMVITNMLKDTKVSLDTAKSGAEALEKTRAQHFDLILMDHMMPEMDGIETFRRIRADEGGLCRETPVIMLTANALSGVRERYMKEGFTDYLSKPVRSAKLEEIIIKYLPPELVKEVSPKEEAAEEAPVQKSRLSPLMETLPEFNPNIALPYCCDNEDFLIEILRDYAASTRYADMNAQFEAEDFENYRINAHSLKSTSLNIGLCGLSERARASEFALKRGDVEFARSSHADLMEMYKDALDKIGNFVSGIE